MKKNQINIFELISRINDDFGNLVYIPHSFPSVDVKIVDDPNNSKVIIRSYDSNNSESPVGNLIITWNDKESRPKYNLVGYTEQTSDGETTKYDDLDWKDVDLYTVISQVVSVLSPGDEPNGDEDPSECWESGMTPDDYLQKCVNERTGIYKGINSKTVLTTPWY